MGVHLPWTSPFPPPPPLFFFQSHRCEEREGKRASEDQRTEAEERSYGRFFLFFFFCVCVCVFASSLTLLVSHSGCRVSRRSSGVSFMSTGRGREKKEQLHMRERHHACTSMCFLFMACCTKAPSNDNTNRKTKQKNGVFFCVLLYSAHLSLSLSLCFENRVFNQHNVCFVTFFFLFPRPPFPFTAFFFF